MIRSIFIRFKKLCKPNTNTKPFCPVCGCLCIGKGGLFCANKPKLVKQEKKYEWSRK